jgi:uncharacterized protein (DUF362 family)/ferredoxin
LPADEVVLERCPSYEPDLVEKKVQVSLDHLGGMAAFVRPGQRVLLKVNLLTRRPPEDAVTTHPALVRAVVREVQRAGGQPVIYDSPGGPFTRRSLEAIYETSGLKEVALETGAELNYNLAAVELEHTGSALFHGLTLSKAVIEADVIINLPKLKSHGLTRYTGAVKNLFGCIPGLSKAECHVRLPEVEPFSRFLVELARQVAPALTIMDAVVGMEGEGPSAGTPRQLGLLLTSSSPFALDAVAVSLLGLKTAEVSTTRVAEEMGLVAPARQIAVRGVRPDEVAVENFEVPPPGGSSFRLFGQRIPLGPLKKAAELLKPRPVFAPDKCRRCGVCIRNCPAKVLSLGTWVPQVDLKNCIRCYCCQELCPEQAVSIYRPWLAQRIFRG